MVEDNKNHLNEFSQMMGRVECNLITLSIFMNTIKDNLNIKKNGATFTPVLLADFLAEKILKYNTKDSVRVLDPSCGDGALLLSIGKELVSKKITFELRGVDINYNYLRKAETRLESHFGESRYQVQYADFLESISFDDTRFGTSNGISMDMNQCADIIIANPPYVRTQLLGAAYAQQISKKYGLKGKVDLYFPFVKAMTFALKEGGILGVITSNKYLNTKSGESIREFLRENYEILEIIDLGDTKLFDAAVLPAIFIGRKTRTDSTESCQFFKIYQDFNKKTRLEGKKMSIYEALKNNYVGNFKHNENSYVCTSGAVKFDSSNKSNWILLDLREEEFVRKIEAACFSRVRDHFKVKIGVKTTADKVFIRKDWGAYDIIEPEAELMYDLISQENIKAWGTPETDLRILYPHFDNKGKCNRINLEDYPRTKEYLLSNFEVLNNRHYVLKSGRGWYEIWVPQNPALWKLPKVVFPDISIEPRFCFDSSGKLVNGNCYWMAATNEKDLDILLFIQGVCNSRLMNYYHSLMYNNKLYAGRKRYFSQYIENYPLPRFSSANFQAVVALVKQLNNTETLDKSDLENKLNKLINEAYGLCRDFF